MPPTTVSRVSGYGGVAKTTPVKSRSASQLDLPPNTPTGTSASTRIEGFETEKTLCTVGRERYPNEASGLKCRIKKKSTPTTPRKKKQEVEEKRMRRHRSKPPASFLVKLERAQTQRMIVLGRKRNVTAGAPSEDIDIVGSTGNIYTVTIGHSPTCTCPDSLRGNECKHKVYALRTVLKAPLHLQYQLALLTSELEEIFTHAPPIPTGLCEESGSNRKSTDVECPICYMDLDEEHNELVWCKAQCGHNIHKSCFDQWAQSQEGKGVRCVYCRIHWKTDVPDTETVKKAGKHTEDGYINVADHFGIPRAREYSGYYQPWVQSRFGPSC